MNDKIIELANHERDLYLKTHIDRLSNPSINKPGNEERRYSPLLTIEDIYSQPDIQEEWLVESIVLQNGITTVSGLPNHFKSLFVQVLVRAVASGILFLGKFKVSQGKVLIIDREIPTIRLKKRWKAIGAGKDHDIYFYKYSDPFKLDNSSDINRLNELVDKYKFKLIVIDTFNRSHSGKETNSYSEITTVFEPLKNLLEKTSLILIHHSNKTGYRSEIPTPEELMGSTDFAAETDLLFTIRKKDKDVLVVHNLKAKDSPLIDPFTLKLISKEDDALDLEYQGTFEKPLTPQKSREQVIINLLKSGKLLKKTIISRLKENGENENTINNSLSTMRNKGIIDSEMLGKEARYFLIDKQRMNSDEPLLTY